MMKNTVREIWLEYRSEWIFGLVLSVLLFASTFLSRLIPEHPEWTVQEVALHCGFSSRQTFTRTFLRETGQTPSEWFSTQNNPK